MRIKLLLLLFLPLFSFAQECVFVDTVYVTAKLRELGNKDIRFGIKQIVEEEMSQRYCLSETGSAIAVEVFYFGIPKHTIRIVGVENTRTITQVGVRIHFNGVKYDGIGESETEIQAVLIEVKEGAVPFDKMTVRNALKKAIHESVTKMP
jgi:hypothetical protein